MKKIIFNDRLLYARGYATLDGSTWDGDPRYWRRHADESHQRPLYDLDLLQEELLAAVGGCHNSLILVQRLLLGEITGARLAKELGRNRSSVSRRLRRIIAGVKATYIAHALRRALGDRDRFCVINPRTCRFVKDLNVWAIKFTGTEMRKGLSVPHLKRFLLRHWSVCHRREDTYLVIGRNGEHVWCINLCILAQDRLAAAVQGLIFEREWIINLKTQAHMHLEDQPSQIVQQTA